MPIAKMPLTEAEGHLRGAVERVRRHEARVLLEDGGAPVAAIVSAQDLRRLDEMEARRQEQIAAISEFSRAFADVPLDELEAQVAHAVEEARAEMRAEREAAAKMRAELRVDRATASNA